MPFWSFDFNYFIFSHLDFILFTDGTSFMGKYEDVTSVPRPSNKLTKFHIKPIKPCHVLYASLRKIKN
jgi:hypothetical protein